MIKFANIILTLVLVITNFRINFNLLNTLPMFRILSEKWNIIQKKKLSDFSTVFRLTLGPLLNKENRICFL